MRTPLLLMTVFALLLAVPQARASDPVHPTTMAGLPQPVRELLERDHGEMADVGGPFSAGCVRRAGSYGARLVWAEVGADAVQVRFEHGGIAGAQTRELAFRRSGDTWNEVALPGYNRQVKWMGGQRRFSSVAVAK